MDLQNILGNIFTEDTMKSFGEISKAMGEVVSKGQTMTIDKSFVANMEISKIIKLVPSLNIDEKVLISTVYSKETPQEKLLTMNVYNHCDDEDLSYAYERFVDNVDATEQEKDLLFDTLNSDPDGLYDIWYNYYFSDIIASEKADEEFMNNVSHDDIMSALEKFQNNDDLNLKLKNAFKMAGDSCQQMFAEISNKSDEIVEQMKDLNDKLFKNNKAN